MLREAETSQQLALPTLRHHQSSENPEIRSLPAELIVQSQSLPPYISSFVMSRRRILNHRLDMSHESIPLSVTYYLILIPRQKPRQMVEGDVRLICACLFVLPAYPRHLKACIDRLCFLGLPHRATSTTFSTAANRPTAVSATGRPCENDLENSH
jgi:hypothetical protein